MVPAGMSSLAPAGAEGVPAAPAPGAPSRLPVCATDRRPFFLLLLLRLVCLGSAGNSSNHNRECASGVVFHW
jgi:hypothetical protein